MLPSILLAQNEGLSYFDCQFYNYFSYDTTYFDISAERDSQMVELGFRLGLDKLHPNGRGLPYSQTWPTELTSHVNGLIDTSNLKKVMDNYEYQNDTLDFLVYLYSSNIYFYGEVIDKRVEIDPDVCFTWRTSYVLRVDSIIYSNIDAASGDFILAKTISGPKYPCPAPDSIVNKWMTSVSSPHEDHYEIGQSGLYLLSNMEYYNSMRNKKVYKGQLNPPHEEEFCPNFFTIVNKRMPDYSVELVGAALDYFEKRILANGE